MITRSSLGLLRKASSLSERRLTEKILGFRSVSLGGYRLATVATNTDNSSETQEKTQQTQPTEESVDFNAILMEKDQLLSEKDKLLKDLQNKYQRSLAENQNVIQRSKKLVEDAKLFGIQSFSKDLLDVKDVLEKATDSVPKEELETNIHLKNLYEGLTLTDAQLQKVFNKNGLEKVDPLGEKFDPHSHEAVFQINVPDKENNTVALVQKIGYKLNGRTLRPAQVGVVKN